ncbi:putative ABC transporter ATP-binding protein [bacterium BMS3Abin02]|nr:putative ABC transporter ATP-binding protein [bacterium BMS3Abin02]GBE22756.1 putative ABC transporter ATP-binding protein [bacterium BMS3Bbin01]
MSGLKVDGVRASIDEKQILEGIDLEVPCGELHVIMGPNGSGKSTLSHVLTGKEGYEVEGSATLDGVELLDKPVDERAKLGLLQAFQYPVEVPGVRLRELLLEVGDEHGLNFEESSDVIEETAEKYGVTQFLDRPVNVGLSGGEKKRSEIFQMAMLRPRVAILDEIDSGLDIDAVREVAAAVEEMRGPDMAVLLITHYSRILKHMTPDRIHVLMAGRIVESGGRELADELEAGGYEVLRERLGIQPRVEEPAEKPVSEFFTDTPFDF